MVLHIRSIGELGLCAVSGNGNGNKKQATDEHDGIKAGVEQNKDPRYGLKPHRDKRTSGSRSPLVREPRKKATFSFSSQW